MQSRVTFGLVCILGCHALWAGSVIRLKTRDLHPPRMVRSALSAKHLILQFEARPGPRLLAALAHRRIRVLAFLPDSALMVAHDGELDLRGLDVLWAGPMEAVDKISPALANDSSGVYLVMFHPDVESEPARDIVQSRGLQILENPGLLPGHLLVAGHRARVLTLAAHDAVAYIMPARTELALRKRVYGCPGALTPAGSVADYVLADSGWPADASGGVALGYFFESLTPKLDSNTVQSEIERALAQWARY